LVLRFFAHRQRRRLWRSGTRLDDYLTRYLKSANQFPPETLAQLTDDFHRTTKLVYDVLGDEAFWLWRERRGSHVWVDRPTLIAYDSIMYAFGRLLGDTERLVDLAPQIRSARERFYETNYNLFDGRRTNASDIARRDDAVVEFLQTNLRTA